jgi:hypothetical protein
MIRKIALGTIVVAVLTAACGAPPPETITDTTAPLFIDTTTGFGPFVVAGNIPSWGYVDVFSNTASQRWRGDFDGGSQHVGRVVVPTIPGVSWAIRSPQYSFAIACPHTPTGPSYAPCSGQFWVEVSSTGTALSFTPAAFVVGYAPPCPHTPGMTQIHLCGGTQAYMDGSGWRAAVISDGLTQPGLPWGNPLKLQPSVGVMVECQADLTVYGLSWSPPPGYVYGQRLAAVYACSQ